MTLEPGFTIPLPDNGLHLERNERDLIVRLLKRFAVSVAKNSTYEPSDVAHPMVLALSNQCLKKFGEPDITPEPVKP